MTSYYVSLTYDVILTLLLSRWVLGSKASVFFSMKRGVTTTHRCTEVFTRKGMFLMVEEFCLSLQFFCSLLFFWSWFHLAHTGALLHWSAFDHCDLFSQSGTSGVILYPCFSTPHLNLVSPAVPLMQNYYLFVLYKFETNLGNTCLIVRPLLSQGTQANISSGTGKCKWVLRESTTRSI